MKAIALFTACIALGVILFWVATPNIRPHTHAAIHHHQGN